VDDRLLLGDRTGVDGETAAVGNFIVSLFVSAAAAAAAAAATSDWGASEGAWSGVLDFREKEGPRRLDCSGGRPLKQRL